MAPHGDEDGGGRAGMALEVDALRELIARQLASAGVLIPEADLARVSTAVLDEAVRISVEWLEAESVY